MSEANLALASGQLQFAALLALVFSAVTGLYLVAMWHVADRLSALLFFLVHTLFLGWQSNIAYMAVIAMSTAHGVFRAESLPSPPPWALAPWVPEGATALYASMLALCLGYTAVLRWGKPRR